MPRTAVQAPETSFIILRAGAATSHFETILHELRQEWRAEGLEGIDLDNATALAREVYRAAMQGLPLSTTDALVAPYVDEPWYRTAFGEGPISDRWSSDWWGWAQRNFEVSATPYLEHFDGPVLWFLAGRDQNVPLVPARAALERAFAAAPGDDHEIVVVEGARHSFLIPSPEGPPRYSDEFFSRMGEWLEEHDYARAGCWEDAG